jgi:hypothetical protein
VQILEGRRTRITPKYRTHLAFRRVEVLSEHRQKSLQRVQVRSTAAAVLFAHKLKRWRDCSNESVLALPQYQNQPSNILWASSFESVRQLSSGSAEVYASSPLHAGQSPQTQLLCLPGSFKSHWMQNSRMNLELSAQILRCNKVAVVAFLRLTPRSWNAFTSWGVNTLKPQRWAVVPTISNFMGTIQSNPRQYITYLHGRISKRWVLLQPRIKIRPMHVTYCVYVFEALLEVRGGLSFVSRRLAGR